MNLEPESNKRIDKVLTSLNRCPYEDRKNVNPQRIEGTCEWFRNHKQFKQWDEGSTSGLLWVSADPGCGKSVLSRYLVDNELKSPQRTVCYFFFKDGFPDQQSASVALCSLLRQLFLSQRHLLGGKTLASIENERSTLYSSFNQLWDILLHVAKDNSFGETVCVLDALDECWRSDFEQLSTELVRFYMKKPGTKLKFLLLSRPYDHIQWNFQTLKNSMPTIHLSGESEEEMEDIVKEIDLVVKHRIATIGAKRRLRPEECDHLQSLMTAVPNRTYLWATLTLDVVENMHGFTRGNVIRTIKKLPETVDQAYTSILARGSDIPKALRALRCVATARRPLWVKEVMVMTAVEEHHASFDDLEEELEAEERFQTTLRNLCGLCLVVIGGKVYFLHQTVREFLVSSEQESNCEIQPSILEYDPTLWKHALDQTTSHRVLAQACIWYLLLPVPPIPGVSSQRGFDGYSLEYWDHHFRESATEGRDILMLSAIKLLDPAGSWWRIEASSRRKNAHHSNFPNALLSATVHNLPTVVEFLLQETEGIDVNATDAELNRSSLAWAADRALRSIVVMLTKHQQTNVNIKDCNGNTPLILAVYDSEGGMPDTTIVYSLLRHEQLDFYARNKKGQSALDVAQQWPAIEFFDEIDSAFSSLLKSRLEAIRAHWYTRLRD
ncbi:hypothetical protein CC80DRAFT_209398 [Byssothecium circinans]|uniref:Uncharacterized protein n=1 Tax=Byssothecium circinans TaxID=147558 RepID=A0A6A5TGL0_9PLEO|nr:hypothetical protein CC80DRAFT_209398 [Byssothecium circinans]